MPAGMPDGLAALVLELLPAAICVLDRDGAIVFYNEAAVALWGRRPEPGEKWCGSMKLFTLAGEPIAEADGPMPRALLEGRSTASVEAVLERPDGTSVPLLAHPTVLRDADGRVVGAANLILDITERLRRDEALRLESIGRLAGGVAQDFNNLLTVMIGNGDALAQAQAMDGTLRDKAARIVAAARRAADLTQHLLAFGRRQHLTPVAVDCGPLLEEVAQQLRTVLGPRVAVTIGDCEGAVTADRALLAASLVNLVLNAADALPGGGTIRLSAAPGARAGTVALSVADSGQGMAPATLAQAFEPFFTTKQDGGGAGLGLSMVQGFARQSGGEATIESTPGSGTVVRLTLPEATPTRLPPPPAAVAEGDLPKGRERVLVAEDDPFVRDYVVDCLEDLGYDVTAARDGREALARLDDGEPVDVLFADVVMPGGISGIDLADKALQMRPGIKILLTSGYAAEMLQARHGRERKLRLLSKPYRRADLARLMRETIDAQA